MPILIEMQSGQIKLFRARDLCRLRWLCGGIGKLAIKVALRLIN